MYLLFQQKFAGDLPTEGLPNLGSIFRDLCTRAILLPCRVKNVLNRSFTTVNSLFARVFALPGTKIISRAKVSFKVFTKELHPFLHSSICVGWNILPEMDGWWIQYYQ